MSIIRSINIHGVGIVKSLTRVIPLKKSDMYGSYVNWVAGCLHRLLVMPPLYLHRHF